MGGLSLAEANDPPSAIQLSTLTILLADGLSALATQTHAIPILDALLPMLDETWRLTPIVIATQARVALADPIAHALHADASLILIGERPGLSSSDSLGAYLTWAPRPGRTDAERNCISNIRAHAGLDYDTAAHKIAALLHEARRLRLTGIPLREPDLAIIPPPA
jgi:ethanolamine ammonia-lyase small subunit